MSTATTVEPETLADAIHALGDIPLHRIRWRPFPGTATEEDLLRCADGEPKRLLELIDGILVEKAMGFRESLFAGLVIHYLTNFVLPRRLGLVGAPDAIMRLRPGLIRLPDVSFIAWDRLMSGDAHNKKVAPFGPDLAIEILSDANTRAEIAQKRSEFFAAGTRLAWVIDRKKQIAEVYADPLQPNAMTLITESGTLDGGDVLPGFTLSMSELFAHLDPPAAAE